MGRPPASRKPRPEDTGRAHARWIAEAARLLAEGHAADVAHACRRAAERLGISRGMPPPAASAIAEALLAHQRLFGGARHHAGLAAARAATCEALKALAVFDPLAIGGVVDGSRPDHADILLVAYADDELTVMHHLAERGIPTDSAESGLHVLGARGRVHPELRFRAGAHGFRVSVLPAAARGQALCDRHGDPLAARADLAAMKRLAAPE